MGNFGPVILPKFGPKTAPNEPSFKNWFKTHPKVPKNGISDHVTKKRRPLFVANYPPKWWITCLFHAFITFGWVLSQFLKFGSFGAVFGPNLGEITGPKLPMNS